MSLFAIFLILLSTGFHAGWNLMAKGQAREDVFFLRMLTVTAVVGFIPFCVAEFSLRCLTPLAWACVLGSGLCCGGYYICLARAYASGDFTTVYPVARALPVVILAVCDALRGNAPSLPGWLGVALVVLGALLAPLISLREFSLSRYVNKTSLWMVLTASGTVGYTLLDKAAAGAVSAGPAAAAIYGYAFFVISLLTYTPWVLRRLRRAPAPVTMGWLLPGCAATMNFGAYWLILWAYQLTQRAGYVVAFRQFSIVIGVVLGFICFREQGRVVRIIGALLITAGLAAIGFWGR
ncbi:MAG: hypothetical protein HN742_02235 [Lentisphaerae bacterium]|jgi:uncharacterized membrane protein|nr:hypothetical protein [Lentisphaerota bacterium]MBT4818400.1 hypothetical protein [Lentisphaerota bacterium]MBT5610678.1 hypothetical protein [Lentisphaerota bacterium]MBT7058034.1 hypothetical protein [Lentisphaerota bacterium]MBT7840656.1 hypothetical protein [Lentisphaerota bacterium]